MPANSHNLKLEEEQRNAFVPITIKPLTKYGACDQANGASRPMGGHCELANTKLALDGLRTGADAGPNNEANQKPTLVYRMAKAIPGLGIMFALCASIFLCSAGMLVKLTHSVHGIQVAVFRAMIQFVIYGFVIHLRKVSLLPGRGERLAVFMRALLGGTSITFSYFALKLIPLGDATTIRFSLPIWTLIVSYLVLGESCSFIKICAVVTSVCGVLLIAKADDCIYVFHLVRYFFGHESKREMSLHLNEHKMQRLAEDMRMLLESEEDDGSDLGSSNSGRQLEGCLLALISSVCLALSLIALRLCKRTPAEVTVFHLSIFSILIGTVTLVCLDKWSLPDNLYDVGLIILNGIFGSIGQWFITSALKIEQSGVIALARTFDIEIAFLYSALLLHEEIKITSVIGSVLVSGGVLAVVIPKWLKSRSASRPTEGQIPANGQIAMNSLPQTHDSNLQANQPTTRR